MDGLSKGSSRLTNLSASVFSQVGADDVAANILIGEKGFNVGIKSFALLTRVSPSGHGVCASSPLRKASKFTKCSGSLQRSRICESANIVITELPQLVCIY